MKLEKLAGCLIIENGKVLLVKERKDWYYKLPGGKLEPNETSRDCAVREIKEEINVDVEILGHFGTYQFNFKNRNFELVVYRAKIKDGNSHITESHLEAVQWFPIEFLNSVNSTPSDKLIYNDLK